MAGPHRGDPLIDPTAETPQPTEAAAVELDAWSARFAREPVGHAPIDLICILEGVSGVLAESSSAADIIRRKGRLGKIIMVSLQDGNRSWGEALTLAFDQVESPLFVISEAGAEWNRDILDRLLKSVDHCDLVLGCRPCESYAGRIVRRIASFARGVFWGAGVADPLTPYKLGRSDVFRKFPLQSASRFAEVELVAKANFLDALIDEIALPVASSWNPPGFGTGLRADRRGLFRKPLFRHPVRESHGLQNAKEPSPDDRHDSEDGSDAFNPSMVVPQDSNGDVRKPGIDG